MPFIVFLSCLIVLFFICMYGLIQTTTSRQKVDHRAAWRREISSRKISLITLTPTWREYVASPDDQKHIEAVWSLREEYQEKRNKDLAYQWKSISSIRGRYLDNN